MTAPDLPTRLRALGLLHIAEHLNDIVALATKKRMSPVEIVEHIVALEEADRARRSLERRTQRSRLSRFKPMSDFDWNWPTKIDREAVESAVALDFLEERRNVVLVAPQGLGKTMIAQNIAHQAILTGYSVLFVTAAQVLLDLRAQESARALERRLKHYASIGLLVMDEIGYLAFSDWPTIFPSATSAIALIDRVVHHADVLSIEGKSYRLREAEEAKRKPRPTKPKKPRS